MRAAILAAMVALAVPAAAREAREYRTVTWYADHPAAMAGVLKLCRNNSGLAEREPNCRNAEDAGILVAQRELNRHGGNPYTVDYWKKRPLQLQQQMFTCDSIRQQGVAMDRGTARMCGAVQIARK